MCKIDWRLKKTNKLKKQNQYFYYIFKKTLTQKLQQKQFMFISKTIYVCIKNAIILFFFSSKYNIQRQEKYSAFMIMHLWKPSNTIFDSVAVISNMQ